MSQTPLADKRVLILGGETEVGGAIARTLADAGSSIALVAATSDTESAYAVQRLTRKLAGTDRKVVSQAIDATNRTAVRVMLRQVAKQVGGLHAAVLVADEARLGARGCRLAFEFASEEFMRGGGRAFVAIATNPLELDEMPEDSQFLTIGRSEDVPAAVAQVVGALAEALDNS